MLHNLAADNLLSALLNFVNELISDWELLDKSTLGNRISAVQKTVKLAYISNNNACQYILAMHVDNKISFRSYILDMTTGCDESKNTLRATSFFSPSLFGPFPESFQNRLESAYASRNRLNQHNSYCLSFPLPPAPNSGKRGSRSSSRESKWPRNEFAFPTPSPDSSLSSFPGTSRGRGNFQSKRRGKKRGQGFRSQ